MKYCFGIDVGGTTIKLGLFSDKGELFEKWEITTDKSDNGSHIIKDIAGEIEKKLEDRQISVEKLVGIGLGVPGPVIKKRIVNSCVNLGWGVYDVKAALDMELKAFWGDKSVPIAVENDANVAALGEYASGAGKDYKSIVMVTLGTGVGGGVIIDGNIISGATGAAGEIGHMPVVYDEEECCNCGKKGCLEQVASATGIVRVARKRVNAGIIDNWSHGEELTAKMVFDAMKKGDKAAEAVIDEVCEYLATALAHITCVINPEAIVIGGGVSGAGTVLTDKILKYYRGKAFQGCRDTAIVLAGLGNDAGIYGAAMNALMVYNEEKGIRNGYNV